MAVANDPTAGEPEKLRHNIVRIVAPNPSPMTYWGTNTYIIGTDQLAVIDPGPDHPDHFNAICDVIADRAVSHIFVTHSHLDHSPLAAALAQKTGAPVLAFGDSASGQSAVMRGLAKSGMAGGGEGIDTNFAPDVCLADGDAISGGFGAITAIHTPGHMGNHLSFAFEDVVFTGDHVMGWASSMVSPPDGDLTDFMASCEKLRGCGASLFLPGHGSAIVDPQGRLEWLINHRNARTDQIILALKDGPLHVEALTKLIYTDAPDGLLRAAARNVFAHLVALYQKQVVTADPVLSPDAEFRLFHAS